MWFRINELLPLELQKDLPDGSPSGSAFESHTATDEGLLISILAFVEEIILCCVPDYCLSSRFI